MKTYYFYVAAVLLVGGGVAKSQTGSSPDESELMANLAMAKLKSGEMNLKDDTQAATAYGYDAAHAINKLAANPAQSRAFISGTAAYYYSSQESARLLHTDQEHLQADLEILQAAQNTRLVEQNDRIIALLEKIAAKK